MLWFSKSKTGVATSTKKDVPANLWVKCESCKEVIYRRELEANFSICNHCGFHFKVIAPEYVKLLLDEGTFEEMDIHLESSDPLKFAAKKKYTASLKGAEARTDRKNGVISGMGKMHNRPVSLAVMDFRFVGGSLGSVEGEKITRALKRAYEQKVPCIVISASGGARMQEGALSLMQMAKTSAWIAKLDKESIPFISILTNPTTGGVTASYAMLGDVNIAEPGALIGFAGERVIRETIRQNLPEGFQRAEFLKEHGFVDKIYPRDQLKNGISLILEHMMN